MRKYIKQYKVKTSVAILTIILSSMISVLGAFFLAGMVNAATTRNVIILRNYFFGALIYLLVLALVGRIDNHLQNSLAKNINISLRNDIFSSIIKLLLLIFLLHSFTNQEEFLPRRNLQLY
ncbi:MAG: hypothetical protein IKL49_04410 [Lachnospiraceae bacterium]|nr:hypothetical protein [Lachnospiraceae bacterium]